MNSDDGNTSIPHPNRSLSVGASSSTNPFANGLTRNDGDDEIDTSSFEDLSMNAALGIDASEYIPPIFLPLTDYRTNQLSFKRKQVQQKPLSRFISHLYFPTRERQQRPTIQIPPLSPDDDGPHPDGDELDEVQDFTEQGYGKEMLGEWVSEAGVGARKYDDLTAIGIYPPSKSTHS